MKTKKLKFSTLKHVADLPRWEKWDIFNLIKTDLKMQDEEGRYIEIINHEISRDDEDYNTIYFEVYSSSFFFDAETSYNEFCDLIIRSEHVTKEYKTGRGLLQNAINSHRKDKKNYERFNLLTNSL